MNFRFFYCLLALIYCLPVSLIAQRASFRPLDIGDKVPDLPFQNIRNTDKQSPRLSDYKGKLVILDFWASNCAVCIGSFPAMEKLQEIFLGQIEIILMNPSETYDKVKSRLGHSPRFNKESGLSTLMASYHDSAWRSLFPHQSVPHHVWIDTAGKVLAITSGYNTNEANIRKYLSGQSLELARKRDLILEGYSVNQAGLIEKTHPGQHFRMSSVFSDYVDGSGGGTGFAFDSTTRTITYKYFGVTAGFLYQFAYRTPTEWKRRILYETSQQDRLQSPKDLSILDEWENRNVFNYELRIPFEEEKNQYKYFREDLNRYMAYKLGITGSLQKRKMKAYVFVRNFEKAPANENGKKGYLDKQQGKIRFVNFNFSGVVEEFRKVLENVQQGVVVLDETGLMRNGNYLVSLTIETGDLKNIDAVRKSLQKNGLDILETEREVELVVIRDLPKSDL
ncbi:TlpA family protein disulfide reductase [Pseudobacter ginsenosidimutans]|uniref:Thiol-disulfide isomerase/thioredoxin n=1 Tax=Pseudobacter ginsenosidimutans TaxID=661488 RepID=A0A4V2F1T1_9BACT|nr:TlpA disulfide reductase family protein [Pseudobacter ginsenosidimutans]QEC43469.1 TlpA family protein disulfide reductase [Pseudobacter ginsenosidimutans]RZS74856.1 thiol-disulfide isomerase/thioredoxin [Pseudobacter ginsenosidimutans]